MYSATFAMIAIIGIAVTNLFLGFATAVLLGRGPKRLSDIDRAIVLQPVDVRGWRLGPRPAVERVAATCEPTSAASPPESRTVVRPPPPRRRPQKTAAHAGEETTGADRDSRGNVPKPANRAAARTANAAPLRPVPAAASETEQRTFVLAPENPVSDYEHEPPEKVLSQQLDAWRHGNLSEETPSVSGLKIPGAERGSR